MMPGLPPVQTSQTSQTSQANELKQVRREGAAPARPWWQQTINACRTRDARVLTRLSCDEAKDNRHTTPISGSAAVLEASEAARREVHAMAAERRGADTARSPARLAQVVSLDVIAADDGRGNCTNAGQNAGANPVTDADFGADCGADSNGCTIHALGLRLAPAARCRVSAAEQLEAQLLRIVARVAPHSHRLWWWDGRKSGAHHVHVGHSQEG